MSTTKIRLVLLLALPVLLQAGYDFIKVYNSLTEDVYRAMADEATVQGLGVVGHVPLSIRFEDALSPGHYSFEHLIPYHRYVVSSQQYSWAGTFDAPLAAEMARQTRDAGVWNCPTLTFFAPSRSEMTA